jgi:hypothetical protein
MDEDGKKKVRNSKRIRQRASSYLLLVRLRASIGLLATSSIPHKME